MPAKLILSAIAIILIVTIFLAMAGFFIPLAKNIAFNQECRDTLLKMERLGGLSSSDSDDLLSSLTSKGFVSIDINGTPSAKQGDKLRLKVTAIYSYQTVGGFFQLKTVNQGMEFDYTSMARKVIN